MSVDKKLAALLSRGHAQPKDVLSLDLGRWPVPDHDPDALLQQRFIFRNQARGEGTFAVARGFLSLPEHPGELDRGHLREIYDFEPSITSSFSRRGSRELDAAVLAHETIHLMQFHAANLDFILGVDRNETPLEKTRWGGVGPVLEPLLAREESEHKTAQRHAELRRTLAGKDQGERHEIYPLLYRENQARLHQIVASYVRQGHEPPQNRRELVALSGVLGGKKEIGSFAPGTQGRPEDVAAWQAALDIREGVLSRLKEPHRRAAFFKTAVPEMYGTLLEFYGDPRGRVKMGFPASPVYARNIADQILFEHFSSPNPAQWRKLAEKMGVSSRLWRPPAPVREHWSDEKWERMAAKAEPELLGRLLQIGAATGHAKSLRPLLEAYRERAPHYSRTFLQALEWDNLKGMKADVKSPQAALLRHAGHLFRSDRLGDERDALDWQRLNGVAFRKPGRLGLHPDETQGTHASRRKGGRAD
ncbi:MAG: hypothetical protein PW734_07415 [Verrucomicrobium sp.]|nr:hypothetical protein [Verrucomicrobium sp.]